MDHRLTPQNGDIAHQLRLLGDLRDLLERWLNLARPGQRHAVQVRELLLEIQQTRNALLEDSMATASVVLAQHLKSSQAVLGASLDLLRLVFGPVSPLHNLAQEFLRRAEMARGARHGGDTVA